MFGELVKIGRVNKAHGVKGELKVSIEDRYFDDAVEAESFIMKLGGQPLPYFIEYLRGDATLLLKLEEVDDKETATALSTLDIFMPASAISEAAEEDDDSSIFLKWIGYTILDEHLGDIGKIEDVYELPEHYLAELTIKGKATMVPLHYDLVKSVDDATKTVYMSLPEGILELNA